MSVLALETGSYVHYGAHGVCQVCGEETRMIGRKRCRYYLLRPTGDEAIQLLLPKDAEPEKVHLRSVMTAEEICALVERELGEPVQWISDSKLRREILGKVLREGDTAELIRLVKAMHARELSLPEGKCLPMSDMEYARQAEKLLYNEFHFVLDIPRERVLPAILGECSLR